MGLYVISRPRRLLLFSLALLAVPFIVGIQTADNLSYGLFDELPRDSTSRTSLRALQRNFPIGTIAPVTVLIENPDVDFNSLRAEQQLETWTQNLMSEKERLHISNIQNFATPLGVHENPPDLAFTPMMQLIESEVASYQAANYFVSQQRASLGKVTRASLTLDIDPFSRDALAVLDQLDHELIATLPQELKEGATVHLAGPTASLLSMQNVAGHDRTLLYTLVTLVVWLVLVILLRKWLVALYLIATVGLTFMITMGVTWAVFRLWLGDEFAGIDWTVPLLVFTLLMAVGADYNVLLVSRSDEEIARSGLKRGIVQAITSTGAVITGCGIVMAGTFATLLIGGELTSMKQLGFALAFAVLLDTFVIRTLLVPPFLLLRGQWLGQNKRTGKSEETIAA